MWQRVSAMTDRLLGEDGREGRAAGGWQSSIGSPKALMKPKIWESLQTSR